MPKAAITIKTPSIKLEKYSALSWPKGCSASGGRDATLSIINATIAAAKLISDSIASDIKPTDPVIKNAADLIPIVNIDATIEIQTIEAIDFF